MTDNLAQTEDGEFMYAGQPAWHHKGQVSEGLLTTEEALVESRLDFQVGKVQLLYPAGDMVFPVEQCVTVRLDLPPTHPDHKLGYVGLDYGVVQNSDAFKFFDTIVGPDMAVITAAGAIDGGKRVFITTRIPAQFYVGNDEYQEYVVLTNGHDGRHALQVYLTDVRVVCQNTLNFSLRTAQIGVYLRHTANVGTRLNRAAELMGFLTQEFLKTQEMFQRLVVPIHVKQFEEYVEAVFPSQGEANARTLGHRDAVAELFDHEWNTQTGIKHTWYSALQSTIQYVDHDIQGRKAEEDRFAYALFGGGAAIKDRALRLAIKGAKKGAK